MSVESARDASAADAGAIRTRVVQGIAWKGATQAVVLATRFAVGVVLARLLSPQQFGLAGIALALSAFLFIFTDLSFGAAIVQRPRLTERDRSTVFWTTTAVGVACTAAGISLSGVAADFFHRPQVASLFAVLSLSFLLSSLGGTQIALLTREMNFRALQLRLIGAEVGGGVAAVAAAVAGLGAWAIIVQVLSRAGISLVLLWWASPWRPRLVYSFQSLRSIGGYGSKLLASRMLTFLSLNADNLLIGRFLGSVPLGIYSLSYNLMLAPMGRLAAPIHEVAFPAFARIQDEPRRLGAAWLRSKRLAAVVLAPAFIGIIVSAPDLVPVVFGRKWHAAIPVVVLLSIGGLNQVLGSLNWSVLSAMGRATTILKLNVFETALTLAGFAIGLHWGVKGVAAGFAIAQWSWVVPETWAAARSTSTSLRDALAAACIPGLAAAGAMGAAVYGLRLLLVAADVPQAMRLAVVVAFGAVFYAGLLRVASPLVASEVLRLVPRRPRAHRAVSG